MKEPLERRIIFRTDPNTNLKLTEIANNRNTTISNLLREYLRNGIRKDTRKGDGACYIKENKKNMNI